VDGVLDHHHADGGTDQEAAVKGWTPKWLPLVSERELLDRLGAALSLYHMLEDRVGDLEAALKDAGVPIPTGRSEQDRRDRTERGIREFFPEYLDEWRARHPRPEERTWPE
jgi:hypothetical protein